MVEFEIMSPMIENEKKDDLIIIEDLDDSKISRPEINLDQNNEIKSIIVNRVQSATNQQYGLIGQPPKSILKTSSKLSKSFDQSNMRASTADGKKPILKRHSFDVCLPSKTNITHSILKHSHSSSNASNDEETPTEDDQKPIKPILKKNKSFEHFQSETNQLTNIKPILKKNNHL